MTMKMIIKKYIYSDARGFILALASKARDFADRNEKETFMKRSLENDNANKEEALAQFEKECRELCEGGCGIVGDLSEPGDEDELKKASVYSESSDASIVLRELLSLCRNEANVQRLVCIYNMVNQSDNLISEASKLRSLTDELFCVISEEKDWDKKASCALSLCEKCDSASYSALGSIKSLMKASKSTVDMLIEKDVIEEYISCYEKIERCALFSSVASKSAI